MSGSHLPSWDHSVCPDCWVEHWPDEPAPVKLRPCCVCGTSVYTGLWVAADPLWLPCEGSHVTQNQQRIWAFGDDLSETSPGAKSLSKFVDPVHLDGPVDPTEYMRRLHLHAREDRQRYLNNHPTSTKENTHD